ncbi:MAG: SMI1/KNR4 family protein [Christensenellales bacterium]|jgi:hypothetical protein
MITLIKKFQSLQAFRSRGAASPHDIEAAESALSLKFADDYCAYVAAFGAASYYGHELTGICKAARLNVVDVTQDERQYNSVPVDWYVIEQTNIDGIVIWQTASGTIYETCPGSEADKICDSLEEYISLE